MGELPPATRTRLESYAIACYAGYEAQKKFCPSCEFSGDDDENNASELLCWVSSKNETLQAHLTLARLQARDLVERYWKEIQAVAAALLEHKTLTPEQVQEVRSKAMGLPTIVIPPVSPSQKSEIEKVVKSMRRKA
jgi:hypothetical protein